MDQARSMFQNNRSTIVNILYIVAFIVVAYYVYKFLTGVGDDAYLSGDPLDAGNLPANKAIFSIADPDTRPKFRINDGGDFAISTWIYISSYSAVNGGKVKPIFYVSDAGLTSNHLLMAALYPNENKMMIRAYTGTGTSSEAETDYTLITNYTTLVGGSSIPTSSTMPQCDIQNVDMQRWINITVAVSGRIMDVYLDGKLTRSCILPGTIRASDNGVQSIVMVPNSGFKGYFSRLRFYNKSPTPDQIYANYQAGPYEGKGFLEYAAQTVGVKFKYTGANNEVKYFGQ